MTLEICILWKGVPHGLALILFKDPKGDHNKSFRGIGVFDQGQLHNTPFLFILNYGSEKEYGCLHSKLENGRPIDKSFETLFHP